MGHTRNSYRILTGKPLGNQSLGKEKRKWKENIKTVLREIVWRLRSGWNWLRIVPNGGLWYWWR
jgi:hypothetical protein